MINTDEGGVAIMTNHPNRKQTHPDHKLFAIVAAVLSRLFTVLVNALAVYIIYLMAS